MLTHFYSDFDQEGRSFAPTEAGSARRFQTEKSLLLAATSETYHGVVDHWECLDRSDLSLKNSSCH